MGRKPQIKKEFNLATDGAELEKMIKEASSVKEKIKLYSGTLSDIKTRAKKELGVETKLFNEILNIQFKQNRNEVENQKEEVLEIYDNLFNKSNYIHDTDRESE